MSFTLANWSCISASLAQGQETVTPFGGSSTTLNSPNFYTYGSPNDTAGEISAANYFLPQYASLSVGDFIVGFGTDTTFFLRVTAVSSTSVTTQSLSTVTNQAVVTLTLSQFQNMYTTPILVVPAPGAGLINIINSATINFIFGSAQLTGGGVVGFNYGGGIHLANPLASATEAATDYTSAAENTLFRISGGLGTGAITSDAINTAIYISNQTALFAGGTDGSFIVTVNYTTTTAS